VIKKSAGLIIFCVLLSALYTNCDEQGFVVSNKAFGVSSLGSTSTNTGIGTTTGSGIGIPGVTVPTATPTGATSTVNNVLPVTVGCGYVNEPCVSVTICAPGTSDCQTIPNVLLDTGSYGLRLFASVVTIGLPQVTDPANPSQAVAECVSYADGSGQWGPVAAADIVLSGEKASNVPIQIVDSTYATPPSNCTDLDVSPATEGFNGILGVGLFVQDCGPGCESDSNNNIYFSCAGSSCESVVMALNHQVTNPISAFPIDNNGVLLQLPAISTSGALTLSGSLIMGIGTQSDNTPSGTTTFAANSSGNFGTTFNGASYNAFIDSGSNGLYFPDASITPCPSGYTGFYCPASPISFSASQIGSNGQNSRLIGFSIANGEGELEQSNPNMVFNNLGGAMASDFDWGLPFFFGRNVYVGISGRMSTIGMGPFWAY
jgi:hypothetical protein